MRDKVYKFLDFCYRMIFRSGVFDWRILFLLGAIFFTVFFTLLDYDNIYFTGYAITDCIDSDYNEDCSLDSDCEDAIAYVTGSNSQQSVETDGSYLVYKDNNLDYGDIYLYDISTGESVLLSTTGIIEISPDISSGYVVWQALESEVWQIYVYDLSNVVSQVLSPSNAHQITPSISSDWIVWADYRNGDWDIYGYSKGSEYALVNVKGDQYQPKVYGNTLVYVDDSSGSNQVYLYDLYVGTFLQLSNEGNNVKPDVDENYVVWQSDVSDDWDLYAYSLSNGEISIITDSSFDEKFPRISGEIVVWLKKESENNDIYYTDLSTGNSKALTSDSQNQYVPVIFGPEAFWIDYNSGDADIYGVNIYSSCYLNITDCENEEICDDGVDNNCNGDIDKDCIEEVIPEDLCFETWDCSNIEWSECINGISTFDVTKCIGVPESAACFTENYLPETEKSCTLQVAEVVTSSGESSTIESTNIDATEVPFFTWFNLFLVFGILIGYYAWRK